ncbi:MAG: hypothetical protein ACREHE_10745 [Rhizomicrobium sp.]
MGDSIRIVRAIVLLAPLTLTGCDTMSSFDLSAITSLWDASSAPAPAAAALRVEANDEVALPDGLQNDNLLQPFGDTPTTVTAANGP